MTLSMFKCFWGILVSLVLFLCYFLIHNEIPKSLLIGPPKIKETVTISTPVTVRNESLLSIQMVIIPFLDYVYNSSQKSVIERLADYKLSLKLIRTWLILMLNVFTS